MRHARSWEVDAPSDRG